MVEFSKNLEAEGGEDKSRVAVALYKQRFQSLKIARDFSNANQYTRALSFYKKYLGAMAAYMNVSDDELHPNHFDHKKDLKELFLIAQTYWDLAKIYNNATDARARCITSLDKFMLFTLDFKYQNINFYMLRKYINSKQARKNGHHNDYFKKVLTIMKKKTKSCYIAGHCLGENHHALPSLREFKNRLNSNKWGGRMVEWYYLLSPAFFNWAEKYPRTEKVFKKIMRSLLLLFAMILEKIIGPHSKR